MYPTRTVAVDKSNDRRWVEEPESEKRALYANHTARDFAGGCFLTEDVLPKLNCRLRCDPETFSRNLSLQDARDTSIARVTGFVTPCEGHPGRRRSRAVGLNL